MRRILFGLSLLLTSHLLSANPVEASDANIIPCFNKDEAQRIGKQINDIFRHEFCEEHVDPQKLVSISQNILSKIITASFLGVTPPENWQFVTDDIIKNCLGSKVPCTKDTQKEIKGCIQPRIPMLLLQFGPWFAENCSQLNKSLIQQWPAKEVILKNLIKESKTPRL
ncbi:hypothetical protein [Legionella sp. WA2024007413]